jgi:sarcosine oxidase
MRYPTLLVERDEIGVFEPDGGVLKPEAAIAAHLRVAERAGAQFRFETAVSRWEARDDGFEIHLADGSRISAGALILAMGPWFQETLGALGIPIRIQRNVQAWFRPRDDAYSAHRFVPFLLDRPHLPAPLYGFPDFGDGVKAAFHAHGELTTTAQFNREIDPARDIDPLVAAMEQWMPGAAATLRAAKPCPYSLTPDGHFVIDRHPQHDRLILCGGFSGHGFKFAPVVGEIAADLALEGASRHEIEFLATRRFASAATSE